MDELEIRLFPCRLGTATYLTEHACQQNRDRLKTLDRAKRMRRRLADKLIGYIEDAELLEPCRTCPGALELGRQSPEKVRVLLRTRNDRPIPKCKNGHLMVADNVVLDHGKRRCRTCRWEKKHGSSGNRRDPHGSVHLGD